MCDLCTQHGDGKIWYKNARNYAQDLLSDLERRKYIENFLTSAFGQGITRPSGDKQANQNQENSFFHMLQIVLPRTRRLILS